MYKKGDHRLLKKVITFENGRRKSIKCLLYKQGKEKFKDIELIMLSTSIPKI